MSKLALLTAIVSLIAISAAPAADITPKSEITSVTVYLDRAMITRQATVKLNSGPHKIVFDDLPGGVQDQSVRAWGKGTAKTKLLGLTITRQELARASDADIRKLEDKIEAINVALETIAQERSILDTEKNFLDALSRSFVTTFNRAMVEGSASGAKLMSTQDLVGRRLSAIADRRIDLDKRERDLKKTRSDLQENLNRLSHPGQTEKKTLTVDMESSSAGSFNLEFSYIIANAGWTPLYDIRADSGSGKVEIVSKAQVRQQTGEDWDKVALVLSTAAPQIGGDMPEPTPLVLDFESDKQLKKKVGPMGGAMATRRPEAQPAKPEEKKEMTTSAAEVVAGETAVEYKIRTPRSIASDGKPNLVPIGSASFDGKLNYLSVPIENAYAYLQAKVKNTSENSFLPGRANIFLAGKFVGNADLPKWAPGEEVDLPLGIDEGISISRKLMSKKTDTTTLGKTTVSYEWRIEIKNNLARPVALKLFEPIPLSRNNDIEVKTSQTDPKPDDIDEDGKAKWDLTLAPGSKTVIIVAYRIKYPTGRQVENMP